MNLLTLLIIVFLSPLLLILLVDRRSKNWLVYCLKKWDLLRALKALEHVAIMVAIIAFLWDIPVRRDTLTALKEEAKARKEESEDRKAGAEGRAWSLIYQAQESTGDGGRRYALKYLHGKGANLAGLPLAKAYLAKVDLPKANLGDANLAGANLGDANLRGANLQDANLAGANLRRANLRGANLQDANLAGANLSGANLRGANLFRANLRGAQLYGADLRGGKLHMGNLVGARLSEANLRGAYLAGADLAGADLARVNLREADLRFARLYELFLIKGKLREKFPYREANIDGANISGADLRSNGYLSYELFRDYSYRHVSYTPAYRLVNTFDLTLKKEQIDHAFYCEGWPPKLSFTKLPFMIEPLPTRKCTFWGEPIEE